MKRKLSFPCEVQRPIELDALSARGRDNNLYGCDVVARGSAPVDPALRRRLDALHPGRAG